MGDTPLQIRFGAVDSDKIISALDRIEKSVTGMASKTDEEAKKVDKTFSDLGNKMAKGVAAIGIAVAGAASTAAIGIWKIVSSSSDMISEFDKMSQKTGIAIEGLQGLQYAAKMADVDFSEMSVGLKFLAKNAADFSKGTGDAVVAFKSLGVSAVDTTGKLKPTDQLLLELADKFSRLKDGPDKAALALDIFGRSGTEMIPVLNMGAKGIAEYTGKFKDFGEVIGGGLLQKNEEFERVTKNLSTALTGIKLALANELFPIVTKYIDKIDEWIVKNKELISSDVGGALDKIAKALPSAEQMISVLDNAVKALKYVADNINGIILIAKTAAEIMATIWVTTKLNNYSTALNTFAAGLEGGTTKTLILRGVISDLGWVINKAIPLLAAFIVGWEIGKAIGEWKIFGKVIDDLVAAREKDGDISRQTAKQEAATVEMLNTKYNQHFKSLAEWNTYLDGKKKESATKQVEIVKKQTEEELKLKKSLTAEELKEIQKYIDDEKKLRGDAYDKLKEQWKQELIQYGKTAEGKAVVDEKFFKLTEALVLADEKKTGDAEWAKVEEKRKANDAAFSYRQKKLVEEDALYASQIQKEIEVDISAGNIFVNNTDEYLGRIYELDNISYEERQKLLDLALAVQKTKYENFVNELNTIMGKVQGVVAGIDLAIKGDIVGGIQQVAAQLGPYGQIAAAGIGTVRMIVSWFDNGNAVIEKHWKEVLRELDTINAHFASNLASLNREIAGMDSTTNTYLETIDDFNIEFGKMINFDTAEMARDMGQRLKEAWGMKDFGRVLTDADTWLIKVAEHIDHFKDRLTDLQETLIAGKRVYQEQIKIVENLISKTNDFIKSIEDTVTGINRRFHTSAQLIDDYSEDIAALGDKFKEAIGSEDQLAILDEIKVKILARYEEQMRIIAEAEGKIEAATKAIEGLRDAAANFAEGIAGSIRNVQMEFLETPRQRADFLKNEIAMLQAGLVGAAPERQLEILGKIQKDNEDLFSSQASDLRDQLAAGDITQAQFDERAAELQIRTIANLEDINRQGQDAYIAQIQFQNNQIAAQNAIITNTNNSVTVLNDLASLQTSANGILSSLETSLGDLNTNMKAFETNMLSVIGLLEKMMLQKYATNVDIETFNKAFAGATSSAGRAAGKVYQHGGIVDKPGIVNPLHDAFVVTHEMLNRMMMPSITIPKFSIPAPVVNVNVPGQKGVSATNITLNGTFLPGDATRLISELLYDGARAGAGRIQSFNKNKYGGRINMREN